MKFAAHQTSGTVEECDLCDWFWNGGMAVSAESDGVSISQTADLLRFSHTGRL